MVLCASTLRAVVLARLSVMAHSLSQPFGIVFYFSPHVTQEGNYMLSLFIARND
jgi:hypothetical protein